MMLFWPTTRQDRKVRFTVRPAAIGVLLQGDTPQPIDTLLQDYLASSAVNRAVYAVGQGQRRECALARAAKCDQRTFEPFSPRTGSHIAGTQIGKSNCFGIGWGFGLSVGWTLCSYDIQLAPHQRDTLVGQHHSLFSPVSRSYCQARAHGAWAGKVLGRVPRTLDRPQMCATSLGCSSGAFFSSVLSSFAFWQKRSRDQPETAPDRGTDQQNRRSTAELEQHSTAGHVGLRGNLPNICCLLKQRLNRRQASRHCQETLSKCSWPEPRAARLTHTLSLFCFCVQVASKMSHGVNKSGITQHVVAQGGYASEVVRNSQNTAWRCRKKLCIFFFWISHCMLGVGALETWTWWPHLANFRLDALTVVFSGSDSFSRIWSQRERGGGSEIGQKLPLAWI